MLARRTWLILLLSVLGAGCGSLFEGFYYASMEKLGREKRDILAKRVANSRDDQEKAKEQIQTTLEAFQELTGFEGGELGEVYDQLDKEFQRAENRARKVSERIDGIENVAQDLFREWGEEIAEISNARLRDRSKALLEDTRGRYRQLITKMRRAEEKMEPILAAFRDQVLFLKHNLNAQAIQSLGATALEIDDEVAALVADIEASIQEADAFVAALEGGA